MAVQFKLDNEFDLVYAVVYQKVITLPYVDNFLGDIQCAFKEKFSDVLMSSQLYAVDYDFEKEFRDTLSLAESSAKQNSMAPKTMRSFNESQKSKKTVASLIETPNEKRQENTKKVNIVDSPKATKLEKNITNEDIIMENRKKMREKLAGKKSPQPEKNKTEKEKGGKKPRVWDLGGNSKDAVILDRSKDQAEDVQYKNIQNSVSLTRTC